jgi:hypothetical protein
MEHMSVMWRAYQNAFDNKWDICTDDEPGYCVCAVQQFLPGDVSGELTARAICNAHNEALK